MKEIWKDIDEYKGVYQVSNLGRVKSVSRYIEGKHHCKILKKEKILKQNRTGKYFVVCLSKNGKHTTKFVHRLVAKTFIPNPLNKPCVNHIKPVTNDYCDNCVDNLEWATYSENNQYAYDIGNNKPAYNRKGKFGIDSKHNKPINQIDRNTNKIIRTFDCARDVYRELGISCTTICQVCKKQYGRKTAGGYKWEYAKK